MSWPGMPKPLYTTIDGSTHYYDREALNEYLSHPVCAQEGCPDRVWYQNSHMDNSFPERYRIYCFACAFWNERADWMAESDPHRAYVVTERNDLYSYDKDEPYVDTKRKWPLGYGGRVWHIFYDNGETVTTNNLWYGGAIPKRFRNRFRKNARLVDAYYGTEV